MTARTQRKPKLDPAEAARARREKYRLLANSQRDETDALVRLYGSDDPMHPWNPAENAKHYTSWRDFAWVVCRPIVDDDGDDGDAKQEAMRLYRQACPQYIAAALVIATNTVNRLEAELRVARAALPDDMTGE